MYAYRILHRFFCQQENRVGIETLSHFYRIILHVLLPLLLMPHFCIASFFLDFPPDNTLILPALLLITFNCPLNMTHHTDCSLSLCLSAHFAYICEYIVLVRRLTAAGTEQRTTAGGARAGELRHAVLRAKSRAARCFRPHSRLYQSDPATRTISFPQPDFADTAHSSLVGWNRTRPS